MKNVADSSLGDGHNQLINELLIIMHNFKP